MALATYSDLQASVATWLDRTDLTATIPDFIAMAEAAINRDLRHWRMVSRSTAAFDGRYTELPVDWLATIRLTMGNASQGYRALTLMAHDQMERDRASQGDTADVPRCYAHVGDEIEVWPSPNASLTGELTYYAKVPALTVSATTNWLLTNAPDAYLYGSLIASATYLHEDQRLAVWGNLFAGTIAKLNAESAAAATSGTLRIRPPR